MKRALGALVVYALCGMAAHADDKAAGDQETRRLCTQKDMEGTYVLMDFRETPEGSETAWHTQFPYQYLAFYPQNKYGAIAMNSKVDSFQRLTLLLATPAKAPAQTYTLSSDGVLNLYTGNNINYSYRCVAIIAATDDYQKGDLILTGYPIQKGKGGIIGYGASEFYKLYRRWY